MLNTWLFSADGKNYTPVTLPHTAYIEPETITAHQTGTVYYRYSFSAPEEWRQKIVYFEIGAAMQKSVISFNGKYQFTHFGGYQKFFIPLSDDLKYGEINTLDLALDNAPSRDMPPGKDVEHLDFYYHSGLYRDAALRVWNPVHITDPLAVSVVAGGGMFLKTESLNSEDGSAAVSATCHILHEFPASRRFELQNQGKQPNKVSVLLNIFSPDGEKAYSRQTDAAEIRPNCDHTFAFPVINIPFAQLWSPVTPVRYRAEFHVFHDDTETDCQTEFFGIRTIRFDRDGFYLNGVKTFLNGTNRHMEYPFAGNAVTANGQIRDAFLIKRAGYNLVRLSHYNQDPAFLDACDTVGLMVLPAVPGWQAYHANSSFIENAFRDCRELIRSLRNRPSVIMWELSLNEAYPPGWVNQEFHRITHEEYPGPMCYSAGDTWGFYEGWDVLFPCDHMRNKTKPLFLREYGDWAFGGNESTSRQPRDASPDKLLIQTWNFLWSLNRLRSVPGMVGGADWCFFDYNRGCHPDQERSGSMDLYRLPKPKYYFYQSQGEDIPMVYAVPDEKHGKLAVFSNGSEVELTLNGTKLKRQFYDRGADTPYGSSGSPGWETALPDGFDLSGGEPFNGGNTSGIKHPPFTFTEIEPLKPGDILTVTAYRYGEKIAETVLRKPNGQPGKLEVRLRTEGVAPVPEDLVFADILAYDTEGVLMNEPGQSVPVRLIVSGGAEVIGGMEKTAAGIASYLVRLTGEPYELKAEFAK